MMRTQTLKVLHEAAWPLNRGANLFMVRPEAKEQFLGVLGEPHVNVLKLNLALDAQNKS